MINLEDWEKKGYKDRHEFAVVSLHMQALGEKNYNGWLEDGATKDDAFEMLRLHREDAARRIHRHQDEIALLRNSFSDGYPSSQALNVAFEALRVAWYVVKEGYDGNKIELLEMDIKRLKQMLGMEEASGDE